jgi:hypothetical protein
MSLGFGSLASPRAVRKVFPSVSEDFRANVISRFAILRAYVKCQALS